MLSEVFVNLSQPGRNTMTEQIRRLVDRLVNAGRGGSQRSPPLRRRGIRGSCTGTAGDSRGGREATAGKNLPRVCPGDGDHPEDLWAGQPGKGDASDKATPSGLRREGRV
jgi:hypothetical protein